MDDDQRIGEIYRRIFGEDGKSFDREQLEIYCAQMRAERQDHYLGLAIELMMAGWVAEPVRPNLEIMSWAWRRPAIGKRPRGRRFASTDQAYNALKREFRS